MNKPFLICLLFLFPMISGAKPFGHHHKTGNNAAFNGQPVFQSVVDKNGSGDFASIQQAIDHVPENLKSPWLIFVKNGRYEEIVRIPANKPFIHLIGQDKDKVIITFKVNCSAPDNPKENERQYSAKTMGVGACAVVEILAPDFYAENISFENAWGVEEKSGPQALALKINNDRFAFYNCKFRSFQDTWMTSVNGINDRLYVNNCYIEGAVDYFYGGGNAYVENTTFYDVRSGSVIVAPNHREGTKWGYVFDHCVVDGNAAAADGRSALGRPWHNQPVAVYLNTTMKIRLSDAGWMDMGPAAKMFAEYNSRDADGKLLDLSKRRTYYNQSKNEGGQRIEGLTASLTREQVEKYTYKNIINDDDGWDPRSFFVAVPRPEKLKVSAGQVSWHHVSNAIGYVVYRDDQVIGFTKTDSFATGGEKGKYAVRAVNKDGSLGAIAE